MPKRSRARRPRSADSTPSYRLHRASGQAVVTLCGRDFYLGPHGTAVSRREYDRVVGEWLAAGRRPPVNDPAALTVAELCAAFWRHARERHVDPDTGKPNSEASNYAEVMKLMRRLYGHAAVADFGPKALKAVRETMVSAGWCRSNVNRQTNRVRRIFRWGVAEELVPASLLDGLAAVDSLEAGRTRARESDPIEPVAEQHARAILPHVSRQVAAMVELQLLTGMRSGEVCIIRGRDMTTGEGLWRYAPARHKTAHRGHRRVVVIGPKAQAVLTPFLRPNVDEYLFSPAEADAERRAARHAARVTPLSCGNVPGSNVKRKPKVGRGERYTAASYRKAVNNGCRAAFPATADAELEALARDERRGRGGTIAAARKAVAVRRPDLVKAAAAWHAANAFHPHQLRHTYATMVDGLMGREASSTALGHASLDATAIYAARNDALAARVAEAVG